MDRLSDYDYTLPEAAVAQTPLEDRCASKLLWLHKSTGEIEHRDFVSAVDILQPGDLLILNNTRVSAIRLFGEKPSGGKVEMLLLKETASGTYEALAKPGKRLQPGAIVHYAEGLTSTVVENLAEGRKLIRFSETEDLKAKLMKHGLVPLPPYIQTKLQNPERYQTVFAQTEGSAAAPTAGLHFTPELLEKLQTKGVRIAYVTLDVGLDTFRPVMAERLDEHEMHGERCTVHQETAEAVEGCQGRIVAVGTTSVRTLESFAIDRRKLEAGTKTTKIFIRPGYEFKIIDGMFTNFHMPRTTMLIMLSALVPRKSLMASYEEALREGYRFLSFGDSMLIL